MPPTSQNTGDSLRHIRNFCIIAHIDHGKSTLADRFLEITAQVEKRKMHSQFLDMMDLEQEKGITIKMQPVQMAYRYHGEHYTLNLIDTPGHIDFNYEVSRSLAAVEGALLLVDATKGIQAQTISNLYLAMNEDLVIIPVINKIDLPNAQTAMVRTQIATLLGVGEDEIMEVSAKDGTNVEAVLQRVIERIPAPQVDETITAPRALIFDSKFDAFKGVIAYVRVYNGTFSRDNPMVFMRSGLKSDILEVGFFSPELREKKELAAGEIGYVATGLKQIEGVKIGDTLTDFRDQILPDQVLAGYKEPQPMVFANIFPQSEGEERQSSDFNVLKDALAKLTLNDSSIFVEQTSSEALGRGFRCGFLGMLHLDIVVERLKREYQLEIVVTSPSVLYKILDRRTNTEELVYSPFEYDPNIAVYIQEPYVRLEIVTPKTYLGFVMKVLDSIRGIYQNTSYLDEDTLVIVYEAPLADIITDFYDKLKSASSGYASLSYDIIDWRTSDLVRLDILIAGELFESFSQIVPQQKAAARGRATLLKLKEFLPRQWFQVTLQAAVGGKVVAREDIGALRKDVTGYLYGGDYSRKRKLLEKQKKGKKKMKSLGRVHIPSSVFLDILKK
ncbi:translation elongation factor 4 [Patescibacteria group bacterium]|nr:translation elongation factor 4 [Patescibacteria group bacterium]